MDNISDKAKKGFQKGLEFLRSKTQETVEIHKTTTHIKELQRRHEECIRDLGYRAYTMLHKGKLDERALRERYLEALELEKAIERNMKEQIDIRDRHKTDLRLFVPRDTPTCPQCSAVVMALTKFCPECGSPLQEEPK